VNLSGAAIIVGGVVAAAGALLPWAIVRSDQASGLLGENISVSLTGVDLDPTYASAVVASGLLAAVFGLLFLADRRRLRLTALVAVVLGGLAVVADALGAVRALGSVSSIGDSLGPAGALAGIVNATGLIKVEVGMGVWVVAVAGVLTILAGVVAYAGSGTTSG
jgi:hypothetical protein